MNDESIFDCSMIDEEEKDDFCNDFDKLEMNIYSYKLLQEFCIKHKIDLYTSIGIDYDSYKLCLIKTKFTKNPFETKSWFDEHGFCIRSINEYPIQNTKYRKNFIKQSGRKDLKNITAIYVINISKDSEYFQSRYYRDKDKNEAFYLEKYIEDYKKYSQENKRNDVAPIYKKLKNEKNYDKDDTIEGVVITDKNGQIKMKKKYHIPEKGYILIILTLIAFICGCITGNIKMKKEIEQKMEIYLKTKNKENYTSDKLKSEIKEYIKEVAE